jgi:hypothetical protein
MNLTPEQQKRFDLHQQASDHFCEVCHEQNAKFLASELQLERERFLTALRESANVFFREHDLKPCDCLVRYLERKLDLK